MVVLAAQICQRSVFRDIERSQLVVVAVQLCQRGEMFDSREVGDFFVVWLAVSVTIERSRGGDFGFCDFVALANFENLGQCRTEIRVGEVLGV